MAGLKTVLFGKLAVSTRFITQEQLDECVRVQQEYEQRGEKPPKLGEVLEQKGYLTRRQIQSILESAQQVGRKLFGAICLDFNFVSQEQLDECLALQKTLQAGQVPSGLEGHKLVAFGELQKSAQLNKTTPKIGEVLETLGYLKPHQVDVVLQEQSKRIVDCLSCGASLNIGHFSPGQKVRCGQCDKILLVVKGDSGEPELAEIEEEEEAVPLDPETATRQLEAELATRKPKAKAAAPSASPKKDSGTVKSAGPTMLGDFQILTKLGQDSTGVIYKAKQVSRDRLVALKVMNASSMEDKVFAQRFFDGAKKASTINHGCIKRIYAAGKADNKTFVAMEFVEGESVHNILQKQGRIHYETAIKIITKVVEALDHANQNGMIHTDIRPSNILVLKNGDVRLANLGLATKTTENILAIARSGRMAPFYLAPEQVTEDRQLDCRSDIYSVGATLYHMVSGRPPFQGQSPFEVLIRLTEETIPPLKIYDPAIPDSVSGIVEKMLQVEPEDRYQNYAELLDALRNYNKLVFQPVATAPEPVSAQAEEREAAQKTLQSKAPGGQMKQVLSGLGALAIVIVLVIVVKMIYDDYNARTALDNAKKREKDSPAEHDAIDRSYRKVMEDWPGSKHAKEAETLLRQFHRRRYETFIDKLIDVKSIAQSHLTQDNLLLAQDYLARFEPEEAMVEQLAKEDNEDLSDLVAAAKAKLAEIEKMKADLPAIIETQIKETIARALATADKNDFATAKEIVNAGALKFKRADFQPRFTEALAAIEKRRTDFETSQATNVEEARIKASEAALREAREKIDVAMRAHAFEMALKRCNEALEKLLPQHAAELRKRQAEIEPLCRVKERITQKLASWKDKMWTPATPDPRPTHELEPGATYRVVECDPDRVVFEPAGGGTRKAVPWVDLPPSFIIKLATVASEDGRARDHFDLGVFLLNLKQFAQAEQQLQRAQELGEDVSKFIEIVNQYYTEQGKQTIAAAEASFNSGGYGDALKNLMVLKSEHSHRDFVKARSDDIDKMIESIFRKRSGKSASSDKARFYSFASADQLGDWTVSDGTWQIVSGTLEGTGKNATLECKKNNLIEISGMIRFPLKKMACHLTAAGLEMRVIPEREIIMCIDTQGGKSKSEKFVADPAMWYAFRIVKDGSNVTFIVDETTVATFE
ncbi:MAG: serine/threonine-protein kinase, partial [Planctomycetota bacterium]|nr:serine/threonine-protein kinase [Planctomycetota bacterium]